MKVFVFKPSNKNIGNFQVDSLGDVPAEFQKFASVNGVSPYDYLECSGETWTVVRSDEGITLEEGRYHPTHGTSPGSSSEAASTSSPTEHFKISYIKANAVEDAGTSIKVLAVVLATVIIVVGVILSTEAGAMIFIWSVVSGVLAAIPIYILGIIVSALGQIHKATLDTAVNTSPFLATEDKAKAMSLRQ